MTAHGIIDIFHIFRPFKVAKILDKNLGDDVYEANKELDTTLCWESVTGLVPVIYVSFL